MPRAAVDVPLVGRAAQLESLLRMVDDAAAGRPGVVLVAGDAGVGKTRLVTELSRRAAGRGAQVLLGHCMDLGEAAVPYLPFAEALEALDALPDGDMTLPTVREWMAGGHPGSSDRETGRLQLFDAVLSALAPQERPGHPHPPRVLVLEDVHWADGSSRDLLAFLVRRLRSQRLAVVVTVRTDDLHRRHPLRPLLAELGRLPVVERLDVTPFSAEEMAEYLRALSGRSPSPELVASLLERTEGNAYFTEQLLAAGGEEGGRATGVLPEALADILLERVDALGEAARAVVRAAAVSGRRVEHILLAEVTGLEPTVLDEVLREAVARRVLVPSGLGYAFRHALAREAVYGDLLPGERVQLHAAFARALASVPGTGRGRAAELAHHRMESHDVGGAFDASVQAADESERLLAPGEALRHLERVLRLWDAVDAPAQRAGASLVQLTLRAAEAAGHAGLPGRGIALAGDAVRRSADGDPAEQLLARRSLAAALLGTDRWSEGFVAAREAVELAERCGLGETPEAGRAAALAARALAGTGRPEEAARRAEQVLAAARRSAWADVEADVVTTLANIRGGDQDPAATTELLREALGLARRSGVLRTELRVAYTLAATAYEAGEVTTARGEVEEALRRADDTGLSWSDFGLELRVLHVIVLYATGELAESRRQADLAGQRPSEVVLARLSAAALPAAVALGDEDAGGIARQLDGAWHHDGQIAMVAGAAGADLARWKGDPDGAVATVDRAVAHVSRVWEPFFLGGIWLGATGIGAAGDAAERARLVHDRQAEARAVENGRRLLALARETARRGRPRGGRMGPEGLAWLAACEAEWSRVEGRPDPDAWRRAVDAFRRAAGGVDGYEAARCRWRLAEALLAGGHREQAERETGQALSTARRIGSRPLLRALADLGARARFASDDPSGPQPSAGRAPSLTPRELQVLGLLAEGLTNREAGSRLFVSEKTVSVHVTNLLAKLGARSRTEAVTVAHRLGLLVTQPPPRPPGPVDSVTGRLPRG